MFVYIKKSFFLLSLYLVISCSTDSEIQIDYLDHEIDYSGRIDTSNSAATLYWSGSGIDISFYGKSIGAYIKDEYGKNHFNIIIDDDSLYILKPGNKKKYYQLAENLPEGNHKIQIFKRTEWDKGNTMFYGFTLKGESPKILKTEKKKRKIEFYGNSITAGYAVEDHSGKDSPDSTFTNNYLSYAAITARYFNAKYHCICKSGIGIMLSWVPLIMPEMYDRLNPADSLSQWDFTLFTPHIVVVNLFQNDSWLVNRPNHSEFKKRFNNNAPTNEFIVNSYKHFVVGLRTKYPNSHIICALGSMDATKKGSKWPEIIKKAVSDMNDEKMYTHIIAYKNTPGHPSIGEHEIMAESLIHFIDKHIEW